MTMVGGMMTSLSFILMIAFWLFILYSIWSMTKSLKSIDQTLKRIAEQQSSGSGEVPPGK